MKQRSIMRPSNLVIAATLLIYGALVVVGSIRNPDQINPDGVAYLDLADHLAHGRFLLSVSSHWSPLISWCLAPFLAAGVDGLLAMRVVSIVWGGILVAATALLIARLPIASRLWQLLALLPVAVITAGFVVTFTTPDVIMAACLMLFFHQATHPKLLTSRIRSLLCGATAGVAYLAKAYALPFCLVFLLLTIGLRYWRDRRVAPGNGVAEGSAVFPKNLVVTTALVILGCALVSGPWIGVMGVKYGELTISSAASWNHASMCPPDSAAGPPSVDGLKPAIDGRYSAWDDTGQIPRADWSPFAGIRYFGRQLWIIMGNINISRMVILQYDLLGTSLLFIAASPLLLWLLRGRREEAYRLLWLVGAIVVYCGGYLPIYVEERYFIMVLWPLVCVGGFHFASLLFDIPAGTSERNVRDSRVLGISLSIILAVSLTAGPYAVTYFRVVKGSTNTYRAAAREIATAGNAGPVAGTRRHETRFVAYHLHEPYIGTTVSTTPEACEAELNEAGARTFLVWPESPLWSSFGTLSSWGLSQTVTTGGEQPDGPVRVYVRKLTLSAPDKSPSQ